MHLTRSWKFGAEKEMQTGIWASTWFSQASHALAGLGASTGLVTLDPGQPFREEAFSSRQDGSVSGLLLLDQNPAIAIQEPSFKETPVDLTSHWSSLIGVFLCV